MSPEKVGEIFGGPLELLAESKTRGNRSHNGEGSTIDESSRAFPERALLIGKSWSLWMNTKCRAFSCSKDVTTPSYSNESTANSKPRRS